jgi:hypothetical protein
MKLWCALVLAVLGLSGLSSCASHNSHRIAVDLVSDFDPLIDEAYAQLVKQWPPNEPGGTIGTHVRVEPVVVRWWPLTADPSEPVFPIEQEYMAQRIEQRLWQLMGGPPDASQPHDYVIVAELEADLHDPGSIVYGVNCALRRANAPGRDLARGWSGLKQIPRLFCHGCNEAWGGHGSRLFHPHHGGGEIYFGAGFYYGAYCSPSSGATFTKVH